ncbi:MAG: hypothetical protein ACKN9T_14480 [Candidatus Methylumidiphilus sp.]
MRTRFHSTIFMLSGLCFSASTFALQTPSSLFGELVQDVTILTKQASCSSNPYPSDSAGAPLNPPCAPALVTCPRGKIPLAKRLVSCDVVPNASQGAVSTIINAGLPAGYPPQDPNSLNTFSKEASNTTAQAQCKAGFKHYLPSSFQSETLPGYSPWCFYKKAGGALVRTSWYPDTSTGTLQIKVAILDGNSPTILTTAQVNNPLNWFCYPIDYKVTARCVTAPAATGLNRLGIQLK